jgi:hypothetical protein
MSNSAGALRRQRGAFVSDSAVYVHFMSGDVAIITPATNVVVQQDMILVYNGPTAVAEYPRRQVFSCSLQETSPSFT